MAKITVKVKQAIHESVNSATDAIRNFDPASINWTDIMTTIMDIFHGKMTARIKAALREHDYQIRDDEDLLSADVLTREISRKSGINFTDVTNKEALLADLDAHISGKFNQALGVNVRGLLNEQEFKRVMVDMVVEQVGNGRIVGVMSRMRAGVIRKGIVYSKGFAGQNLEFDLAKHARKLDQRKYAAKYRYRNKQVWD